MRRFGLAALVLTCALPVSTPAVAQEMDRAVFHYSLLDVDAARSDGATIGRWDASGWIGTDFDRLWWSTEGEAIERDLGEVEATLLYGRYVRRFWDLVVGYRHEIEPISQGYVTVGLMGLAPYWFEVGLFAFVSDRGRPSARFDAETDLYVTQRLVLTLEGELDLLLAADDELDLSAGARSLELGVRTRYEVRRKLAPYLDLTWVNEKERRTPVAADVETGGVRLGLGLRLIN